MNNKNAPPSGNPANRGNLVGVLDEYFDKKMRNIEGMMPARVISYERQTNRVCVQPLIKIQSTDGQVISRAPIASIPVYRFGGGGAAISFPIQEGDIGWIIAGDRDISLVEQSDFNQQLPNTYRIHSFSNGMFFPDATHGWQVENIDAHNSVIGSTDGCVKISIGPNEITIKASQKVIIEAPKIEYIGNVTIQGDVKIVGALSASGGINGINGLSLETHIHGGVQAGPAMTLTPQ